MGFAVLNPPYETTKLAWYESRFTKIEADLAVIKWMLGIVVAGVASLVVKAFV